MAFIQLVSQGGIPFNVNKYFLQLYDEFFYNLMEEHSNNNIVIYFPDETNEGVEKLVNSVNWKHLSCSGHKHHNSFRVKSEEGPESNANQTQDDVLYNNNDKKDLFEINLKTNEDTLIYFNDDQERNLETNEETLGYSNDDEESNLKSDNDTTDNSSDDKKRNRKPK